MPARVLVAAPSRSRARQLAQELKSLGRLIDTVVEGDLPESFDAYRLLVCELGRSFSDPAPLLARLRPDAHVVLITPRLDLGFVARYLDDERVNHFLTQPLSTADLQCITDKLNSGAIFGLERHLPDANVSVNYRRLATFAARCQVIDDLEAAMKGRRMRGKLVRMACQVLEELLMNAMYQAPVDVEGKRLFADIEPRKRIRRKTPRPVSVRYALHEKSVYLSVRDRFGSFRRADLFRYLHRCLTADVQIEEKKLGAGLGLYVIASSVTRFVINLLPGGLTEFICVLEPVTEEGVLKMLSFTAQRPMSLHQPIPADEPLVIEVD